VADPADVKGREELMTTVTIPPPQTLTCTKCNREHKATGKRLPRGWKRWRGDLYCDQCRDSMFVLRAVSIPIAEPLDADWKQLRTALKLMWRETTQACNWIVTELFARDVRRKPGDEKMPAMERSDGAHAAIHFCAATTNELANSLIAFLTDSGCHCC
jgi:hypothetical protein